MTKPISQQLAEKTFRELGQTAKPQSRSRVWQSPQGYRFLIPWSNALLLRILVKKWLDSLKLNNYPRKSFNRPLNKLLFSRLEAQILDSLRSTIANIEEGFSRPTTSEYLTFLGYSQASMTEGRGDINRAKQDQLLNSKPNSSLADLGINLKSWNLWCRDPGNDTRLLQFPLTSSRGTYRNLKDSKPPYSKISYSPLKSSTLPLKESKGTYRTLEELKGRALTYETFLELTNKTDWHLRKLVASLETKLNKDQKGYQVEQARIKSNLKWRC
jgi:four helix bundle protein